MVEIAEPEDLKGWPILDQESLKNISQNLDFESETVFYSSGDDPKQIPYSEKDLQGLFEDIAEALRELGFSQDDRFLALGLGKGDHQSGTGLKRAAEELGAERVVDSIEEAYENDLRKQSPTAAASLPKAMLKLGKDLQEKYGQEIDEALPEMENIATAGDRLSEDRRKQIKEMWDAEVAGFYVATEPGVIGVETGKQFYEPVSDELIIEVLEEDAEIDPETGKVPEDKIHELGEVNEELRGSLIVSAPGREELSFIRYNLGDKVTAKNGKIKYECRADEVINMSGHHLYPSDIQNALENLSIENWYGVIQETEFDTVLNLHILGDEKALEDISDHVLEQNEVINDWFDYGGIKIASYSAKDKEELAKQLETYELDSNPLDGIKTKKIFADKSYQG